MTLDSLFTPRLEYALTPGQFVRTTGSSALLPRHCVVVVAPTREDSKLRAIEALQAALEYAADADAQAVHGVVKIARPFAWDAGGVLRFPDYNTGT